MVMNLNLDFWETLSLTAGCNLYASKFHLCVSNVQRAHEQQLTNIPHANTSKNMFYRVRDSGLVPVEEFLSTAVPKIILGSLLIFLNSLAIYTLFKNGRKKPKSYTLPSSTQGLLGSLFVTYIILGILTLYSQISLSTLILSSAQSRLVDDQEKECLIVNSLLIGSSISISLHLMSLAVDRTLASYLPSAKYANLSKGTLPLWLLSIWLPSAILSALPISGWKTKFKFCVFLHQFNDDYLRFVSGFFFSCVLSIPILYLFFLIFLKQRKEDLIVYRWHRKLQQHHRINFILVVLINVICWTPFHIFIVLACTSCRYSHWAQDGSGYTLEYLSILSLVPSIIIPLLFIVRASFVEKCMQKLAQCVSFGGKTFSKPRNPLCGPIKSPLFFVDEIGSNHTSNVSSTRRSQHSTSASLRGNPNFNSHFFVPHYLPHGEANGAFLTQSGENLENIGYRCTVHAPCQIAVNTMRKNFSAYMNSALVTQDEGGENYYHSLDSDSDSRYGFQIEEDAKNNRLKDLKLNSTKNLNGGTTRTQYLYSTSRTLVNPPQKLNEKVEGNNEPRAQKSIKSKKAPKIPTEAAPSTSSSQTHFKKNGTNSSAKKLNSNEKRKVLASSSYGPVLYSEII